jgi:hypothetical protein
MKRGQTIKALQSPEVKALSAEIDSIRGELHTGSLDAVRRMGVALERGARLLSKDLFEQWWRAKCFSKSTVRNYRGVAHLSRQEPAFYARCQSLDPTNVYRILSLPKADRLRVLDIVEDVCATDLSAKAFHEIVAQVVPRPPRASDDSLFVATLPARTASFVAALDRASTLPPARLAKVRQELLVVLRRVCPLAVLLQRRLGGIARPSAKPPAPTAPTLPSAPPKPGISRPSSLATRPLPKRKPQASR